MEGAGRGADAKKPADIDKQEGGVLSSQDADGEMRSRKAGIGLGEKVAFPGFRQQMPPSPEIFFYNVHRAGQHDSHGRNRLPAPINKFIFQEGSFPRIQTAQKPGKLPGVNP